MAERFFPQGVYCIRCDYELSHLARCDCPECGKIQTEQSIDGHIGTIDQQQSDFAARVLLEPRRLEAAYRAHLLLWKWLGVVVFVILCAPLIYAIMKWDDDPRIRFEDNLLDAVVVVAPVAVLGYALLMIWQTIVHARDVRRKPMVVQQDVEACRVEWHRFEATHGLRIVDRKATQTLLRLRDGRVMAFRRDTDHWFTSPTSQCIHVAVLPMSRVIVGMHSEGETLPVVEKRQSGVLQHRLRFPFDRTMMIHRSERFLFRVDDPFETRQ